MGFNSAFKGLNNIVKYNYTHKAKIVIN